MTDEAPSFEEFLQIMLGAENSVEEIPERVKEEKRKEDAKECGFPEERIEDPESEMFDQISELSNYDVTFRLVNAEEAGKIKTSSGNMLYSLDLNLALMPRKDYTDFEMVIRKIAHLQVFYDGVRMTDIPLSISFNVDTDYSESG